MAKKTPKTARARLKGRAATPAPYALSTFEAPETHKASIRNITRYLVGQITGMGMSVVVSRSRISKSQSQYLEVDTGKRQYKIRISDHALRHRKKHDFDIYTHTPYEKGMYYMDFIKAFRALADETLEIHGG